MKTKFQQEQTELTETERKPPFPRLIGFMGFTREASLRFDILVAGGVMMEANAVEQILPIHKAPLHSYLKLLAVRLGRLINSNEVKVSEGISR